MERVFGTLQERLPPLLRLHGITTIAAANRYPREVYIAEHNRRFALATPEEGSAFVPFLGALRDILCVRHERVVGNDTPCATPGGCCRSRSSAIASISSR
jgi:hypothetical protein